MRTLSLLVLLANLASAEDLSRIEHSLRQSYVTQTRTLQKFYSDSHLKYDASGALVGPGHPGSWTLGYVTINRLKLTQSQLEVRGNRVAVRIDETNHKSYIRENEDVRIDIALSATPDEATLRSAMDRVFYMPDTSIASDVPDYWRDLLSGNVVRAASPDGLRPFSFKNRCPSGISTDTPLQAEPSGVQKIVCDGLTIYFAVKGGVKPPKALHAPDPQYAEVARQAKYQGTTVLWLVVDQTGRTQMIRIVRAIGMGLDDAAVAAVRTWLFQPAELNGQSVAVQINVEVNFRLY